MNLQGVRWTQSREQSDQHDELPEKVGGFEVFSLRTETPKLHSPEDGFIRDDWSGPPKVQGLRKAEKHDDEHGEVKNRREVVAPSIADELAQEAAYKMSQKYLGVAKTPIPGMGAM